MGSRLDVGDVLAVLGLHVDVYDVGVLVFDVYAALVHAYPRVVALQFPMVVERVGDLGFRQETFLSRAARREACLDLPHVQFSMLVARHDVNLCHAA